MIKKIWGVCLVFFIGVVAVGCSNSNQSAIDKTDKEEIVLAVGNEPETGFDPTMGWGRYTKPLFQSTLLKRDDDLNIVNDLAEDYKIDSNGKNGLSL
ncbi:MAG: hypothetical protein ACTJHC_09815 [Vagococcus sp.]